MSRSDGVTVSELDWYARGRGFASRSKPLPGNIQRVTVRNVTLRLSQSELEKLGRGMTNTITIWTKSDRLANKPTRVLADETTLCQPIVCQKSLLLRHISEMSRPLSSMSRQKLFIDKENNVS